MLQLTGEYKTKWRRVTSLEGLGCWVKGLNKPTRGPGGLVVRARREGPCRGPPWGPTVRARCEGPPLVSVPNSFCLMMSSSSCWLLGEDPGGTRALTLTLSLELRGPWGLGPLSVERRGPWRLWLRGCTNTTWLLSVTFWSHWCPPFDRSAVNTHTHTTQTPHTHYTLYTPTTHRNSFGS